MQCFHYNVNILTRTNFVYIYFKLKTIPPIYNNVETVINYLLLLIIIIFANHMYCSSLSDELLLCCTSSP